MSVNVVVITQSTVFIILYCIPYDWYLQLGLVLADTWAGSSPSPTQCRQLNTSSGSQVLLTASSLEYWSSVQNLDTVILRLLVFLCLLTFASTSPRPDCTRTRCSMSARCVCMKLLHEKYLP